MNKAISLLAMVFAATVVASTLNLPANASANEPAPYHGNVKSKKFHKQSCRYYSCKNCTREFQTREEAIKAGYVACKVCKP